MFSNRRKLYRAALLVIVAGWTLAHAAGWLQVANFATSQKTVTTTVHNTSNHRVGATLTVSVTQDGQVYVGSKQIVIRAGDTIYEPITPDGITDDIDPLDVVEGEVTNEIQLN